MPVKLANGRLRLKNYSFKGPLGYINRLVLKINENFKNPLFYERFIYLYFECVSILSVYICVYNMCAWYPWRPEEGIGSLEL